jgi:hypothetical protein
VKRSQVALVRERLADGEPHTHHELYELSCVVHSRVADLRKLLRHEALEGARGADQHLVASWNPVEHWSEKDPRTRAMVHWYRLVPLWEFARERTTSSTAAPAAVEGPAPASPVGGGSLGGPGGAASAGPARSLLRHTTEGGPGERIPSGSPALAGGAGSQPRGGGPPAAADVSVDPCEQLQLEREYEDARELEADAA